MVLEVPLPSLKERESNSMTASGTGWDQNSRL